MKSWLLSTGLTLVCAGFLTIVSPTLVSANTDAETKCQSTYSTDVNIKNACVRGYTSGGPCTPYNGAMLEACEVGAQEGRDDQELAQNLQESKSCNIPTGLGSIVCWVSRFIGLMSDGLFRVLETMLVTPSLDQNEAGGRETYKVWSTFRNIANIILVIVIVSIIMSQVTNYGINNYGIKKLLPRLIVGALLINLSFIICGLIIDITNVAGSSIKDILVSVALPVKPDFDAWSGIISIGLVGAAGVGVFFGLFAIGPVIFAGFIALLTTVVILVVRQALLITLVILSPIAFALNIMPSTQKWFGKWWSTFIIMACVFPIIAFIFGATRVAAGVISASAPDDSLSTVIFGAFSLGVLSVPFFITPLLMKAGGGLLNRFTGIINNPSKGLVDRGRKQVDRWAKNKTFNRETNALTGDGKGLYARTIRRRNLTSQVSKHHKSQLKNPTSGAYGNFIGSDEVREDLAKKVARSSGADIFDSTGSAAKRAESLKQSLGNITLSIEVSDIDAAEAVIIANGNTTKDLKSMINNGINKDGSGVTADEKNAAIRNLAKQGNIDDIHGLLSKMDSMKKDGAALRALADGIDASGVSKKAAHLGPNGTQMIRNGGASTSSLYHAAINTGAYNAETLATQDSKALKGLSAELASPSTGIDSNARGSIRENRDLIAQRDKLRARVSPASQKHLDNL